jgi:uncharacterized protein YbdZ (MbtH family)
MKQDTTDTKAQRIACDIKVLQGQFSLWPAETPQQMIV